MQILRNIIQQKELRFLALIAFDVAIVIVSGLLSYAIRLETFNLTERRAEVLSVISVFLITHMVIFVIGGMYRQVWRFANFNNAILILRLTLIATVFGTFGLFLLRIDAPRSIPIIFWFVVTAAIASIRFSRRLWKYGKDRKVATSKKKCLIYGAGAAGEMLVRHAQGNPHFDYEVVGFIDDDRSKKNRYLHGKKIFGNGDDIPMVIEKTSAEVIIIAIHSVSGDVIQNVVKQCQEHSIAPFILPELSRSLGTSVFQPRMIDVQDLLRRVPKTVDQDGIRGELIGKIVVVTGAGGSIGSEICKQVLSFSPSQLILVDNCEYNLYRIESVLTERSSCGSTKLVPVLASVADEREVSELFEQFQPDVILHAAAYKHVPLVEQNPKAAIKNNILGTRTVLKYARKHRVKKFVLISTDKAVRPTNIMGATKRCCELMTLATARLAAAAGESTAYCAVRFGNVLGSSGSVIPRFMAQIEAGGPVTVTHEEVTRYFMLKEEAVALVLQSMKMSIGGEIFVLDMGKPVRIYDMAKQLIFLSGHRPDEDIRIVFTGLRPGEKLYEELLLEDVEQGTLHDSVFTANSAVEDPDEIMSSMNHVIISADDGNLTASLAMIKNRALFEGAGTLNS